MLYSQLGQDHYVYDDFPPGESFGGALTLTSGASITDVEASIIDLSGTTDAAGVGVTISIYDNTTPYSGHGYVESQDPLLGSASAVVAVGGMVQ